MFDKYRVEYNGHVTYINHKLVETRKISEEALAGIKELHRDKLMVFEQAREATDTGLLKKLALKLQQIEFDLQALWGFPQDHKFHRWYEIPQCKCPKIDNEDRLGTNWRVINETCPVHGNGSI